MPKEPGEKLEYLIKVLRLPRQEALVGVAAEIASDILSKKPRVRTGGNPPAREELVEVATADFEKRLRETGVWDAMDKKAREEQVDWFRKRALKLERPLDAEVLSPAEEAAKVEECEKEWDRYHERAEMLRRTVRRRRRLLFLRKSAITCLWWLIFISLMVASSEHPWSKEHPFAYLTGLITFVSVSLPFVIITVWPKRDAYGDLVEPNYSLRDKIKIAVKMAVSIWIISMLALLTIPSIRDG